MQNVEISKENEKENQIPLFNLLKPAVSGILEVSLCLLFETN